MKQQPLPLLARQPILDRELRVVAYELLCRPIPSDNLVWQSANGDQATSEVVIGAMHEIGLELVTGGLPAFVNLTEQWLHTPLAIEPDHLVAEVLEHIKPTAANMAAVQILRDKGYRIAIDDYIGGAEQSLWLPLADIVKVDLLGLENMEMLGELKDKYQRPGLQWLAEKVENYNQYEYCKTIGYDLFQGYFYSKPMILYGHRLPDNQMAVLQLLQALNRKDADINEIGKILQTDPQLSFRLLQMVNSSAMGCTTKVTSIQRAIMMLGLDRIRNWTSLLALGRLDSKPRALQEQAMTRAFTAQELAGSNPSLEPDTAFTLGLFSLLDAFMDVSLEDICSRLVLPDNLSEGLLRHEGQYGALLQTLQLIEKGEWNKIPWKLIGITPEQMSPLLKRALVLTRDALSIPA